MQGVALSGVVHGGQQPVTGSTVTLYAAGAGGDGSSASALTTAITGSSGTFSFTANSYSCTSNQQMYVVATQGNPGLTPSTVNNAQLSLVTALGACGNLKPTTNIAINELTTVAAASALANYATSYAAIGSASGDATAMANAFTLAGELVDTSAGTVPGSTIPASYTSPASEIYTLGDIIATCVNSAGGTGSTTNCGMLFTDTTPYQGTAPSDTFGAALLLAKNPNQNVSTAFGLATTNGPFQPVMTSAPADWTVPLLPTNAKRILFVGDSFTHGRYSPVRNYNSANVTDENYNIGAATTNNTDREETTAEPGPYGGIPGIFKELTVEGGVNYDVHIEAISSTSLQNNYSYASSVIANQEWNTVVLQELSTRPIPTSLSGDSTSNPSNFCSSVKTIEQGLHASNVNPSASIYLYETWARADESEALVNGSTTFAQAQTEITTSYHNVYYEAASAANDSNIAGVAPAGDAWLSEINTSGSDMMQNPYGYSYTGGVSPFLWFLYQSGSSPSTSSTAPDYLHPSIYGAYLNALVLYEKITGLNSTNLGSTEAAAAALGISGSIAVQLQSVAHAQVMGGSTTYTGTPCSVT